MGNQSIIKNPVDQSNWLALAETLLSHAKAQGATAAEVHASTVVGLSVNVRLGEVETVEYHQDKGVNLTVYFGQRSGSASTSDTSEHALQEVASAACNIAKVTGEDPYSGLADSTLLAYDYPDLDLYHAKEISAEQAIMIARDCETQAREQDKRITNSDGASFSSTQAFSIYANSLDFCGGYASTRYSLGCSLIAQEGEEMQSDGSYTTARAFEDLWTPTHVARDAAQRTLRRLGARRLSSRAVPVIFEASIASGLIGNFIAAIRGGNLYRKASFLLDKLGQSIFPSFIHIYEQPHLLKGQGSSPFDAEGVRTRAKDFVKEGILQSYVLGSYSARKLGMQSTGNADGVHNLFVEPTHQLDLPALLKAMGTGLLVTHVMGQGVNIITGDYSRGASGFWVENGEIQYPVHEITIAGNLRDMFSHIQAVGNDVDPRGNIHTGSIWVENMMVGGE